MPPSDGLPHDETGAPRRKLAILSFLLGALSLATSIPLILDASKAGGNPYQRVLATAVVMGVGGLTSIGLGGVAVYNASKRPALYGGKWMALGGVATGALSLGFAGLLDKEAHYSRCRYAYGETTGALRAVVSVEEIYASSNGGFYDVPECLAAPRTCIPGYPEDAPVFLDEEFWTQGSRCYERRFHPGPEVEPDVSDRRQVSPSSLKSYAVTAVPAPAYPYDRTQAQRFCADSSGRICFTSDGSDPIVIDGLCAPPCTLLE